MCERVCKYWLCESSVERGGSVFTCKEERANDIAYSKREEFLREVDPVPLLN